MKPILVIEQEQRLEGLGLLEERLERSGLTYRRLQTWREPLADVRPTRFAGVIPLGGNMHAWDEEAHPFLRDERRLLREAVDEGVPVLGVCLGAQLLARALGSEVWEGVEPEIGWLEVAPTAETAGDPVFGHLEAPTGVFHWHLDVFDLPDGAVHLATSASYAHQAYRFGTAWGIQFHPEIDYEQFSIWIANHTGDAAANGVDEEALHEDVRRGSAEPASHAFRVGLFDAFLELTRGSP